MRRALSMAIDRRAIVERVMEGAAIPAGQFLPPGTFSYVPDLSAAALRPRAARSGCWPRPAIPQGFRITLHGPNDRYLNDATSSRRSARCGRASACARRWRRCPGPPSSPAPSEQEYLGASWSAGAPPGRGVRSACATSSPPRTATRAWARPTAAAIPTRRSTRCSSRGDARAGRCEARKRCCRSDQRMAFDDVGDHPAAHPEEHLGDAEGPGA